MPLTAKGAQIKQTMEKEYGAEKGEQVFYASRNKGTIAGVDAQSDGRVEAHLDAVRRGDITALNRIWGRK